MKMCLAALAILFVGLAVTPAPAQVYENGPVNGTIDAWPINFGYVVSDSFYLTDAAQFIGFDFYSWVFPGDKLLTVDWSIVSNDMGKTQYYGGGTAEVIDSFVSSNQFGFEIHVDSIVGLDLALPSAGTYWLTLQDANTAEGNPLFWDQNSGIGCDSWGCPSQAFENSVGTIPSEAFTIIGFCGVGSNTSPNCGAPAPEPSSILLFGSGALGFAGVLRRKL